MKLNRNGVVDTTLIAAIVAVLLVGGFVWWRIASADDSTEVSNTTTSETAENDQQPIDTVTTDEEEFDNEVNVDKEDEAEQVSEPTNIGETANSDVFDVTLVSRSTDTVEGNSNTLTRFDVTITNVSGQTVQLYNTEHQVVTSNRQVLNVFDAWNQSSDPEVLDEFVTLADGGTLSGFMLFDTTEELSQLIFGYTDGDEIEGTLTFDL